MQGRTPGQEVPVLGAWLENHAALLTDEQLATFQTANDIATGAEWNDFAPGSPGIRADAAHAGATGFYA